MPNDSFYKSREWHRLRMKAIKRDGYQCRHCGANVRGKGLAHVDHVIARRKAPELALDLRNLETLCSTCHNSHKKRDENDPSRGARPDGLPIDGSWD